MSNNFGIDLDEINRTRMAMLMGFSPERPEDWPFTVIEEFIVGEDKNGFEWLMNRINDYRLGRTNE